MPERAHVIAGRCTAVFEGTRQEEHCGDLIVLVKPDGTVLVHDAEGYQPVAWSTRASSLTITDETVTARDGDQFLSVTVHETHARGRHPVGRAGTPVGTCPDCGDRYSLPSDATVLGETCSDCGLPRFRVERGASLVVCLDRDCGGDLRVLRRGGLLLGCETYPDCEAGYAFPRGVHDGSCSCGLPAFETASGRQCLDSECGLAVPETTT